MNQDSFQHKSPDGFWEQELETQATHPPVGVTAEDTLEFEISM